MAEAIAFGAATRLRILEEVARRLTPQRVRVFLDGAARDLSNEILIRTSSGRLIEARSGQLEGSRALMLVMLADAGHIEVDNDPAPHGHIERYPRFDEALMEAEALAYPLRAQLDTIGGLGCIPVADLDQLVAQLAELPDAASAVLRLADAMRSVAAILRDSPYDEVLTTRILQRLFSIDILKIAGTVPSVAPTLLPEAAAPESIVASHAVVVEGDTVPPGATGWDASAALPTEDELEGTGVDEDIREWLSTENVPEALLSDDNFSHAFALDKPEPTILPHPELAESQAPAPAPVEAPPPPVAPPPVAPPPVEAPPPREPIAPIGLPAAAPPIVRGARVEYDLPETKDDDDDAEAQAIVGRPPNRAAVLAGLVGVLLVVALFMFFTTRDDEEDVEARVDASAPAAPDAATVALVATPTTATATVSQTDAAAIANLSRGAPPIAGPDAPEDVRKAEQLLNAGSYWEAGKMLAQLRETRPRDPAVWVLSGQHYVDSGGRLANAIEAADKAIEIEPKFYRAWVLKGSVLQFTGRREKAAEAYNRALVLEPNHPMSDELRMVVEQLRR